MPVPSPRRATTDADAVRLFVTLARIALAGSDVAHDARSLARRDLVTMDQEAERDRPRRGVALALADEVLEALETELPLASLVTLNEAREAMDRSYPDLRVLQLLDDEGSEASEAG